MADLKPFTGTLDGPELRPFTGTLDGEKPKPASAVRKLGDVGLGFVQGAAGASKALADASGASNRVSRALGAVSRGAGRLMSADAQDEIAARQARIQEAEQSGSAVDEAAAHLGGIAEAPARSVATGLGSIAPTMIAALLTRGKSLAPTLGIGAAQGAGAVKGSIYDAVEQRHIDAGMAPEQAKAKAAEAQSYTGENAANIAAGAVGGAIASRVGAEGAVLGRVGSRGAVRRVARAAGEEAVTEGAQGGQERYAANVAEQRQGFDTPTWQGVAGQAVGEGVIGGIVGGGVGVVAPGPRQAQEPPAPPGQDAVPPEPVQTGVHPSGTAGGFDPNTAVPEPTKAPASKSQAMGIDPAAGPVSAAAAVAVDNGAAETVQRQQAEQQAAEQASKDGKGKAADKKSSQDTANDAPAPVAPPAPAAPATAPAGPLAAAVQTISQQPAGAADAQAQAEQGQQQAAGATPDTGAARGTGQDPGQEGAGAVPVAVLEPASGAEPALSDTYDPGIEKAKRAFGAVVESPNTETDEEFVRRIVKADRARIPATAQPADAGAVQTQAQGEPAKPQTVDEPAHATAATSPTNDLPEPTEAQKKAGNYRVGRVTVGGLDISIENPQGSTRRGTDKDGKAWENTLQDHYGYIRGTVGNDKDHVDAFIKPGTPSDYAGQVFVVDQVDPATGKFDEHKIVIGANNALDARRIYARNYAKGWKGMKAITPMPWDQFKTWVRDGAKTKPLAASGAVQPSQSPVQPQPEPQPEIVQQPASGTTQPAQRNNQRDAGTDVSVQPSSTPSASTAAGKGGKSQEAAKGQPAPVSQAAGQNTGAVAPAPVVPGTDLAGTGTAPPGKGTEQGPAAGQLDSGAPASSSDQTTSQPPAKAPIVPRETGQGQEPDDWMTELFGTPEQQAQQQAKFMADAEGKKRGIERVRAAIAAEKKRAAEQHDDWAGRVYKKNKTQVELRGDGPSRQDTMSIGAINESRRRNAMEALTQEIAALDKLADQVSTDAGAESVMASMSDILAKAEAAAKSGNWPGQTRESLFESMLLDQLKFRGPGGRGNVTSNGLSKAMLALVSGSPAKANLPAVPQRLQVSFGGKTYPVASIEDAQRRWIKFQETADGGAPVGVSQVGNGVQISDQDGKFVAQISFNGRVWDGTGDDAKVIAEAPTTAPATPATPAKEPGSGLKRMQEARVKKEAQKKPAQDEPQTAAQWAQRMEDLRKIKPRPIDKLYGKAGPTPEQADKHKADTKEWNREYLRASSMQKKTLKAENEAFHAKQATGAAASEKAKPDPLSMTPKQYHEAKLRAMADDTGTPLAEVREMYDTDAGRAEHEQEWVKAVVDVAQSGAVLTRATLDKLLEIRPNTKLPDGAVPQGYQRPEARKSEAEEKQARIDARNEIKEQAKPKATQPEKIEDIGEKIGGARKDTAVSTGQAPKRKDADDDRPAWQRRFQISQIAAGNDEGKWVVRDLKSLDWMKQPKQVGRKLFESKEQAEAALPLMAVSMKHRVVSSTENGKEVFEIWRNVNDRKRVKVLDRQFSSYDDAMKYMATHAVQIIEANTTFGEADLPAPQNTQRIGKARRTGDVVGEDFKNTFGFRGVEFGNWNNQDERQQVMNEAYDGLLDLAEVVGIPPKAIGLNGDLALAFGARGQGLNSAKAHYERGRAVINLTKMNGAGALAHEWFHALDHYFGRQDGKAASKWTIEPDGTKTFAAKGPESDYASSGFLMRNSGVRDEVRQAYTDMVQTLFRKAATYVEDTQKADRFAAATRDDLAHQLDMLRRELSEQKDPKYYKRKNAPASAEQLAEFDAIAKQFLAGEMLDTELRYNEGNKNARRLTTAHRWTNDALDKISAIYKDVRGRSGFGSGQTSGWMDTLRGYMNRYSGRLKMLADAQQATEKTKQVPTDFAMNAKSLDQGRGGDYWTTPHEMIARAFQGYVEDKIAEGGGKSPFLNYAPENIGIITPWGVKRPFPAGDERRAINTSIDSFLKAIQTKEDDAGNVAMFARGNPFYSQLTREVAKIPAKAQAGPGWAMNIAGLVKAGKVKQDEVNWTGILDWLRLQDGKVTREQIGAYLDASGVQVTETVLGESAIKVYDSMSRDELRKSYEQIIGYDPVEDEPSTTDDDMRRTLTGYLAENGEADDGTPIPKYGQYQLPGGTNYREVLLTLPARNAKPPYAEWLRMEFGKGATDTATARAMYAEVPGEATASYKSAHWDQPNVLAHIRVNDRVDADGKRVLFVEEIQSDWGQAGKKVGFDTAASKAKRAELEREADALRAESIEIQRTPYAQQSVEQGRRLHEVQLRLTAISNEMPVPTKIPAAPFVTKTDAWLSLALKRIVKMAADGGYDRVAFVNGDQSAERYDLSKKIMNVQWHSRPVAAKGANSTPPTDGTLEAWDHDGNKVISERIAADKLPDYIGKDVAQKLLDQTPAYQTGYGNDVRTLEGLDLKVGGEGMKAFYDKIVPNTLKDVLKKVGGGTLEIVDFGGADRTRRHDLIRERRSLAMDDPRRAELSGEIDRLARMETGAMKSMQQQGFTVTPAMRERTGDGLPLFRRGQQSTGISIEQARKIIDPFAKRLNIGVRVVATPADLPIAAPSDVRGLYMRGDIYVVAANVKTRADVLKAVGHEAIAHLGLRALKGRGDWNKMMNQMQFALKMGNKHLRELQKTVRAAYVDENGEFNLSPAQEADEIAAAAVEQAIDPQTGEFRPGFGFLKGMFARLAEWLRSVGIDVAFTNLELQGALVNAQRYLEQDARAPHGQAVAAARAGSNVRRGTEEQARAAGFTMRAYRGVSKANPFNDSSTTWLTTDREVAAAYAEEVMGYDDPGVLTVMVNPDALERHDASRLTDEQRETMQADVYGNPQAIGIYDRSDDHPLGGSRRNVTVIHAPQESVFVVEDGDAQFSRGAGQVLTDIRRRSGNKLSDYRALALQTLGRRQLVDLFGEQLPQIKAYNDLMQSMDADKNEAGAEADGIADRWGKLKDERQLAELMHDATLAQIDPAQDFIPGDDRDFYDALRHGFDALSPEAKKLYVDARDHYRAHHAKVRQAIRDRIERSELRGPRKAELLKQMDDEFFKAIKGVYFPLARFGDYVVVVRDPESGRAINVSRAETMTEAQALQQTLRKAYPNDLVGNVLKSKEFNAGRDAVGRGFMDNLYAALGAKEMDDGQRLELEDMLGQLYLSALPDLSWAKHGIHRKGTPGFSQDARRAFAQNMFHGARYLAKVRYSDLLENELSDAQKTLDANAEAYGEDQPKLQDVLNEMQKRHEAAMNPNGNPLSTALTSLGFVFHLGLSPASAMVNMTQTALVAYPIMGAKWGFDKAAAALVKASGQAAANKNDMTSTLTAEERRAFDEAVRSGVIDVTMAHDLAGISQGDDAKVTWKLRPVMKWASFLFHHAEKFNRQVTFVASYRLAREAGTPPRIAYAQAVKATYDGHFDYSATNRARVLQGNTARVLLLFKQYGQNMVYTLARQGYLAVKGANGKEKAEARKALGGLLAMHGAAAGVLGLPLVTTLLAAASMIGGSDDEPWDAEVALRNMLADAFGDGAADALARGLSRLTPFDISGRVGLDRLILPDVQEGLEGQRLGESAMAASLGPVAGIGISLLKGLQQMADGDWARGLEAMAPSVLRGPIKAIRYASEGAIDRSGKTIVEDVNDFGIFGQAMGFSPSDVRLATEAKSAVHQADARLSKRRGQLMRHWSMAVIAGDEDGMEDAREDIRRFNEKNPGRRINPMQMAASVRTRRMQILQAKGGVYLSRSRRDAMQAGAFGMQ